MPRFTVKVHNRKTGISYKTDVESPNFETAGSTTQGHTCNAQNKRPGVHVYSHDGHCMTCPPVSQGNVGTEQTLREQAECAAASEDAAWTFVDKWKLRFEVVCVLWIVTVVAAVIAYFAK